MCQRQPGAPRVLSKEQQGKICIASCSPLKGPPLRWTVGVRIATGTTNHAASGRWTRLQVELKRPEGTADWTAPQQGSVWHVSFHASAWKVNHLRSDRDVELAMFCTFLRKLPIDVRAPTPNRFRC